MLAQPRGRSIEATRDLVSEVVDAAHAAWPTLRERTRHQRAAVLDALADALVDSESEIVVAAREETGLAEQRLRAELGRTAWQLRHFGTVIRDGAYVEAVIDHGDSSIPFAAVDLRRMLVPLGVVAVFAASNFPLAFSVCGGDTASALASGCPVVVKAHSGHPRTSALTAAAAHRALRSVGLPEALLGIVYGREAGVELVQHPRIKAAGFTGSLAGGRALFDLACRRDDPIPFFGELGSINPVVVTEGACGERADAIGTALAESASLGGGQFCTKPGLVFVPSGPDGDRLVAALVAEGERMSEGRMLTPAIQSAFYEGARHRESLPDTRVLSPIDGTGLVVVEAGPDRARGTVLEECFGPIIVVVRYEDEETVFDVLGRIDGTLTLTIHHAPDEARRDTFVERVTTWATLHSGRVVFNGVPTGVAVSWAMHHGGPYPSSTSSQHTSVGATAIRRFLRPVSFQNAPRELLPRELQESETSLLRRVDGVSLCP